MPVGNAPIQNRLLNDWNWGGTWYYITMSVNRFYKYRITWSGEAVFPVPMAQTGSYAKTTWDQSFTLSVKSHEFIMRDYITKT